MNGFQRKKIENLQRMMIMWLYNRCVYGDKEEKLDDVRLHINVSSEESVEKLEDKLEPREKISYKEKLRLTGLIPLTTKLTNCEGD